MALAAAVLTIRQASNMNPKGRIEVANWLRSQADKLQWDGPLYARTYTARYLYLNSTQRKKGSK